MSVIVKTMDMPESCSQCRFLTYDDFATGHEYECTALSEFMDEDELPEGRRSDCPLVDEEPVRHGEWIKADSQQYFRKHYPCFTCSECGYRKDSQKTWNYCPNCSARMDEE